MSAVRNVLFVMCDQLRRDHLSCYGGRVPTPNHRRARRARRALRSRVRAIGRVRAVAHVVLHRPLRELARRDVEPRAALASRSPRSATISARAGRTVALAGKSHVMPRRRRASRASASRAESERGRRLVAGGFVEIDRYDGHSPPGPESGYADYLRAHGYASDDPWTDYVIAAEDRRTRRVRMADAQRAPAVAGRRGAFRDRVHDGRRARLDSRAGRSAVGAAPFVREAALAVHGAGAVSRDVPRRGHGPDRARPAGRHRRRAPGGQRVPHVTTNARASRAKRSRVTCVPRTWVSSRRSTRTSGASCATLGGLGPARRHADRLHVGPRRVPGRPRPRARRSSSTTKSCASR